MLSDTKEQTKPGSFPTTRDTSSVQIRPDSMLHLLTYNTFHNVTSTIPAKHRNPLQFTLTHTHDKLDLICWNYNGARASANIGQVMRCPPEPPIL